MAVLYDPTTSINFSYHLCLDAFFTAIATVLTDGVTFTGLIFWTTIPKLFISGSLFMVYRERCSELVMSLVCTSLMSMVNASSIVRAFDETEKFTFVDQFITIYLDVAKMLAGFKEKVKT